MDPFVQTNRKSCAVLYARAATANARASNRLAAELKTLENQKQREMVKLHNSKLRIKTDLSIPSLYGGHDNGGNLNVPISPTAPSSVPMSPVTSPRMLRRRHSEVLTPSTRSLQFRGYQSKNINIDNRVSRTNSEGKLHNECTVKDRNYTDTGQKRRPSRRSFSGFEQTGNPGMALKGQELSLPKNRSKTTLSENRSRKLSAPLLAVHENRDHLDQKIKHFLESLLAYKRDEDEDGEVLEEGDRCNKDNEVIGDSVPKLPDMKPNTSRTNSLPCLVPRLSLSNLTLESSVGEKDDSLENLKKCRYLRIPDAGELSVGEVFSREEEE